MKKSVFDYLEKGRLSAVLITTYLFCFVLCYFFFRCNPDLFWTRDLNGAIVISDLGYYLTIIRGIWGGNGTRFYLPETHLGILSQLTGIEVNRAMPIGASPTAFLFFLPLALIPDNLYSVSISIIDSLSIVIFSGIWIRMSQIVVADSKKLAFRIVMLLIIQLLSLSSRTNLLLGQTAMIASGLLGWSFLIVQCPHTRKRAIILAVIGTLLSIKIHYFLIYVGIMLGHSRFRDLLLTVVMILAACSLSLFILGRTALADYFNSLVLFSAVDKPALVAGVFASERMIIFKTVFADILGRGVAATWANIGFASLILCAAYFIVKVVAGRGNAYSEQRNAGLIPIILIFAAYLLFTPHMGSEYEDLLISVPALIAICRLDPIKKNLMRMDVVIALIFVVLNIDLFILLLPKTVLWCVKAIVLTLMLTLISASRSVRELDT